MSKFSDDPEFWRFHAKTVRIKSRTINNLGTKSAAQELAVQYEGIARRVEARMRALKKHAPAASVLGRIAAKKTRTSPPISYDLSLAGLLECSLQIGEAHHVERIEGTGTRRPR